ncbi:MAG: CfrBI family restriction endonuclease [Aggregatilineales bacterium]
MSDNPQIERLSTLLSDDARALLEASGISLIETIGMDVIRSVVMDVLSGRNIRSSTEILTRRRIATLNLALVDLFFQGTVIDANFVDNLPYIASRILSGKNDKAETWLANWALGLTGKGVQNVLRDDQSLIPQYRDTYIQTCKEIVAHTQQQYGDLTGEFTLNDDSIIEVNWIFLTYLLNMIGAETLTVRGSEKSLYGKFFEKLVLGAVLHILGFQHVSSENADETDRVFWLASNSSRGRESDATILYTAGKGIRIDIGFIGRGNTEISLDKVSRYRREIEIGNQQWYMGTIIIVDRIGKRSNISTLATEIDGTIIQMSANYWIKRLAQTLHDKLGFQHPILTMPPDDIGQFIQEQLINVPLREFIQVTS